MGRIGITMRITEESKYIEKRDSLAMDWSNYLFSYFPDDSFIYLPNLGSKIIDYLDYWKVTTVILSGGDDIGKYDIRDENELNIIKHCVKKNIPLIGICRGMQILHKYYGGELSFSQSKKHVNIYHKIKLIDEKELEVNSYHTNMIDEKSLHKSFQIIGRCLNDESIEVIQNSKALGIMWHPEREMSFYSKSYTTDLIKNFICNYG